MKTTSITASILVTLTVLACGGGGGGEPATPTTTANPQPSPSSGSTTMPTSGGDQVSRGAKLFADNCASCHGADGAGTTKAPPVVGKNALPLDPPATARTRKSQFHTAADVYQYIKANMPKDKPGSLTDEQYAAILAFDLKANGVDLGQKSVDAMTAPTFVLHP